MPPPPQHQEYRKVRKRGMDQCKCCLSLRPQRGECYVGESGGGGNAHCAKVRRAGRSARSPSQVVDPPTASSSMGLARRSPSCDHQSAEHQVGMVRPSHRMWWIWAHFEREGGLIRRVDVGGEGGGNINRTLKQGTIDHSVYYYFPKNGRGRGR
jgi:hypothetical protein